ncbi:hypothetical protein [Segetibacter aerophilus]|uniref:Uncharacterized protein n=1 Tax=Segetibacter aerophilus TaxID=670293 RepID=A0A512BC16_9BACT|nr:hypothetical protein [Segetibacter aerophilus]GEO09509.1 hypothetical protein SAE01_20050 [Segetibacter aerophilus]
MFLEKYQTIGVASDEAKLKLAAILFDKVCCTVKDIPVPKNLQAPFLLDDKELDTIHSHISNQIEKGFMDVYRERFMDKYVKKEQTISRDKVIEHMEAFATEPVSKFRNLIVVEASKKLFGNKTLPIPIFNQTIFQDYLENDYRNQLMLDKVEVEIINAPIIVASELQWSQISEAKKDSDFNKKVKRFSLFINKNYKGKDISFIIDDLSIQIEDYKEACNKHGIRLANETFKSLSTSKSLFGTVAVVLCSLLLKMPEYAIVSGLAGASLELLNLKVTVNQFTDNFETFVSQSPI